MASKRGERQVETRFNIMLLVQENPSVSTREIAERVGISNGAAYYCLNALIEKGYVKLKNFTHSKTKSNYFYELTPQGLAEKASLTVKFLESKKNEFAELKHEIHRLEVELSKSRSRDLKTIENQL